MTNPDPLLMSADIARVAAERPELDGDLVAAPHQRLVPAVGPQVPDRLASRGGAQGRPRAEGAPQPRLPIRPAADAGVDTGERRWPAPIEGLESPVPAAPPIGDDPVGVFELEEHGNDVRRAAAARLIVEMRDPPRLRGERHLEVMLAAEAYLRVRAEEDLDALERFMFGRPAKPRGARTAAANRKRSADRLARAGKAEELRAAGMRWRDIAERLDRDPQTLQRSIRQMRRRGESSGADEPS